MARDFALRRAPGSFGSNHVRIALEQLEDRATPVLFTAQAPLAATGLNNNGCVAVGDLNKDGKPDAVLSNFGQGYGAAAGTKITILYGDGAGGYTNAGSPQNLSTGGKNISYVDLGDVNGDGWLDVAAGNATTNGNQTDGSSVSIFLNNQAGGFAQAANSPFITNFKNLSSVDLADVNGDTKLDLVAAHFGHDAGATVSGQGIVVFAGDGGGKFGVLATMDPTTNANLGLDFIPTNAQAADFNGDSVVDVVATVPAADLSGNNDPSVEGFVYFFPGTGLGAFSSTPTSFGSGGGLPVTLTIANMDGKNGLDILVGNAGDATGTPEFKNSAVGILINNGTGSFSEGLVTTHERGTFSTAAADFNQDGKMDIAAANYGSQTGTVDAFVSLYYGNGAGGFVPATLDGSPFDTGYGDGGAQFVAVGDFDLNSVPDLIVAHAHKFDLGTFTFITSVVQMKNTTTAATPTTTALVAAPTSSVFGQQVTFTATVTSGGGTPGGTVTFLDNGVSIGTGTLNASGVATLAVSNLAVATHPITARYEGSGSFQTSTSSATQFTVTKASTSTALTPTPATSVFGQQVTFTATVSATAPGAGTPTGTVTFFDNGVQIGTPQNLSGGVATLAFSGLSVATHNNITAQYNGDTSFLTSTSAATQVTVGQAATSTALTPAPTPASSVFGQSVTFTATVTATAPGGGTPTGTVTFFDGANPIGTPQNLNAGGVATLAFSGLSAGLHNITARYDGSTNHALSTSAISPYTVAQAAVGVTLGSSADPSNFGQNVTFTATIAVNAPGAGTPTGTVTFSIDGVNQPPVTLSGLQAQFSISSLTAGPHAVTATYNGDASFASSTSSTLTQDVNAPTNVNTTTNVGTSGTPAVVTQNVTFTVTVLAAAGTATGTVTLFDNGVQIPGAVNLALNGGGVATFVTDDLTLGTHPITATYTPTGLFNGSNSNASPINQQIIRANTGVGLGTDMTPSFVSQTVTFTATVVANPALAPLTGAVTFFDGATPISPAIPVTNVGGQWRATFQTNALGLGSHSITAQFGTNGNFTGSTSGVITQVVNKAGTTITSLSSSTQPASVGQTVTFTATIAPNVPLGVSPSGTITFKANGTAIGTAPISGTTATFQTSTLPVGTMAITADYTGDGNFTGTTSGTINQVVNDTPVNPPPPVLVGFKQFGVGSGAGGSSVGQFYNPDGTLRFAVDLFPGFSGGVRVTSADFNGDGVADFVGGTGPGGPSRVRVIDGVTQAQMFTVDPFESQFIGGVYVSTGDLNGDGKPELIISPDEGGGPRVQVYSGAGFVKIADFFGIDDSNFRGGARTGVGDVNGDGVGELVVAAGFGGGPRVSVIDGLTVGTTRTRLFNDFFVFEQALRNGAFIAAGDVDGDGKAELLAGGGPGGAPRVTAFSAAALLNSQFTTTVFDFFAGNIDNRGGVRMSARDLDNDAKADIVVGDGTGAGSRVTGYLGKDMRPGASPTAKFSFEAYPGFNGGVYVG